MRVYVISSTSNTPQGKAIRLFTRGKWSHSLIRFDKDNGSSVYYESYWLKDKTTGKTGVRGPIPYDNFLDWAAEGDSNRFIEQRLYLTSKQVSAALTFCNDSSGQIGYANIQLLQNLKTLITGFAPHTRLASRNKLTCSEFVARAWYAGDPAAAVQYALNDGYRTFDMITPGGRFGLYEAVEAHLGKRKRR